MTVDLGLGVGGFKEMPPFGRFQSNARVGLSLCSGLWAAKCQLMIK